MRRRVANLLRALAWRVDPVVYRMVPAGPITQADVDDYYGGVVPDGLWVLE